MSTNQNLIFRSLAPLCDLFYIAGFQKTYIKYYLNQRDYFRCEAKATALKLFYVFCFFNKIPEIHKTSRMDMKGCNNEA